MPNVFIENATLQNIADAIRNKTGKAEKMLPAEMPAEIESIETGGDNHYDNFWDNYQNHGNRKNYYHAFAGECWNDEIFKPKYPIKAIRADNMFSDGNIKEINVTLDLSECTNAGTMFGYNVVVTTIKDMLVHENLSLENSFRACTVLVTLGMRGVIGRTIDLRWSSRLSAESIENIISCLKDLTGGTAQTLTFHATVGGNLTDTQKATITAKNWTLVY